MEKEHGKQLGEVMEVHRVL